MDENFPERVKSIRAVFAISQEELARESGVSFAAINRWENEKTTPSPLARNQFERFSEERMRDD